MLVHLKAAIAHSVRFKCSGVPKSKYFLPIQKNFIQSKAVQRIERKQLSTCNTTERKEQTMGVAHLTCYYVVL